MSRLKYIITQKGHFALFSDVGGTSHAHVGRLMIDSDDKVIGGGFATLNHQEGPVVVYGRSVSAKVESSDDHAEAIIKSIETGEAFQLLAEEDLIGFSQQWILTNSEELERALLQKVRLHNADHPGRELLKEPKKETLSLNDLKNGSVEDRYHVPDLFLRRPVSRRHHVSRDRSETARITMSQRYGVAYLALSGFAMVC